MNLRKIFGTICTHFIIYLLELNQNKLDWHLATPANEGYLIIKNPPNQKKNTKSLIKLLLHLHSSTKSPKNMIFVILYLPLFLEFVQSAQLVQRPNGYFITGRGCGTTTALKYLNYLPKTLEEHQCSFINLNRMVPIKGTPKKLSKNSA